MTTLTWILIAYLILNVLWGIAIQGRPRQPRRFGDNLEQIIVTALVVYALYEGVHP